MQRNKLVLVLFLASLAVFSLLIKPTSASRGKLPNPKATSTPANFKINTSSDSHYWTIEREDGTDKLKFYYQDLSANPILSLSPASIFDVNGDIYLSGGSTRKIQFNTPGDHYIFFDPGFKDYIYNYSGDNSLNIETSSTYGGGDIYLHPATGNTGVNQYETFYNFDIAGTLRSTKGAFFATTSGGVGIATTDPGIYQLNVNGKAYFAAGFNQGSDIRWKKNIQPLQDSLTKVLKLKGVSFEWDKENYPQYNFPQGTQLGLIAQDVERVIPEVVSTDAVGYKSISYQNLVPLLVESLKKQQTEIQNLQDRINLLETK